MEFYALLKGVPVRKKTIAARKLAEKVIHFSIISGLLNKKMQDLLLISVNVFYMKRPEIMLK